jgi:mannose-6-phosphate isomerase-like protein (cupin superfamily)
VNGSPETIYNPLSKEEVTFVRTARESGGAVIVVDIRLGPRAKGPPLHYHLAHAETFAVIEGELSMRVDGETIRLGPGQQVTAEIGQRHTFWSDSNAPSLFRGTLRPGFEDLENCFRISFGLARDGLCNRHGVPRSFYHLAILTALSRSRGVGVLGIVMLLLERVATFPRCRAIQQELVRKYGRPPGAATGDR